MTAQAGGLLSALIPLVPGPEHCRGLAGDHAWVFGVPGGRCGRDHLAQLQEPRIQQNDDLIGNAWHCSEWGQRKGNLRVGAACHNPAAPILARLASRQDATSEAAASSCFAGRWRCCHLAGFAPRSRGRSDSPCRDGAELEAWLVRDGAEPADSRY